MLDNNEEQGNANSFYSPLCKTKPYLTPEQRRKLREKRNISESPVTVSDSKPLKANKKVKKLFQLKPKSKIIGKKEFKKKLSKVSLPELCCTAAEWVPQTKKTSGNKKFFKTRSPEHLKKAKFVLDYKKSRLEFGDSRKSGVRLNSPSTSPKFAEKDKSEIVEEKLNGNEKWTENPHIVKVAPLMNEFKQSIQEETASELVLESSKFKLSDNKTVNKALKSEAIVSTCSNTDKKQETPKTSVSETVLTCPSTDGKQESETNKPRNYPIFDKENIKKMKWDTPHSEKILNDSFRSKDKSKGCEQMIIDAGQKKIGVVMCETCNMVYTIGHEEDEKLHSENHDMYLHLKFPGWKDERVVGNYEDGRIIKILKDDKHFKLKKVQDVLLLVNRELGFPSSVFNGYLQGQNVMIIMFISSDKFVKGCLVAESISSASPVILYNSGSSKSYYASSETVRAICGINRIWVARKYRKQKVASRMVDCLRSNFILGLVVSVEELAFTDPTEDGMQFASSYTGTENFLVYK